MDSPNPANLATVHHLQAVAAAVANAVKVGAEAYANGGRRGRPIVERHFTAGNQQRYGWPPLSPEYAARKAGTAGARKSAMRAAGRVVPQGLGSKRGGGGPMLVLSGLLRSAMTTRKHVVRLTGPESAECIFDGLPDYAEYLHQGTRKMPSRSPVKPSSEDIAEVRAEMEKYLAAVTGRAGPVAVNRRAVPGQARRA